MANNPWNASAPLSLARYPNLLYADRYHRIHEFLRDERSVRDGLLRLEQATTGMSQAAFRDYLTAEEVRFGFSPHPVTITVKDDLVKASKFWLFLIKRQGMIDLGAGDADHGVLSHRVQWTLVGQWNERAHHRLGPTKFIGELYGNLGAANARLLTDNARQRMAAGWKLNTGAEKVGRLFESVWDDVFDASYPSDDGTRPEYLRGYIQARHSALYARMRW
ncbi:LirA/MavJ family T4SS effector [Muricoccus radiodurans]|uniref:LirA/MavJ family T4SS effector n=1 Tax=Muricoccus radiodurans TaxID=2231721 RepID=UPI003CE95E91